MSHLASFTHSLPASHLFSLPSFKLIKGNVDVVLVPQKLFFLSIEFFSQQGEASQDPFISKTNKGANEVGWEARPFWKP